MHPFIPFSYRHLHPPIDFDHIRSKYMQYKGKLNTGTNSQKHAEEADYWLKRMWVLIDHFVHKAFGRCEHVFTSIV